MTHDGEAESGAVHERGVDVLGGGDAVVDEVQRLAPQGLLESVADIARHLLAHPDHVHADALVEGVGAVLGLRRGLVTAQHLDQGQDIDRVERMADADAFRVLALGLNFAGQQSRRTRGDDHIGPHRRVDTAVQIDLYLDDLGGVFLDKVGVGHGLGQVRVKA